MSFIKVGGKTYKVTFYDRTAPAANESSTNTGPTCRDSLAHFWSSGPSVTGSLEAKRSMSSNGPRLNGNSIEARNEIISWSMGTFLTSRFHPRESQTRSRTIPRQGYYSQINFGQRLRSRTFINFSHVSGLRNDRRWCALSTLTRGRGLLRR